MNTQPTNAIVEIRNKATLQHSFQRLSTTRDNPTAYDCWFSLFPSTVHQEQQGQSPKRCHDSITMTKSLKAPANRGLPKSPTSSPNKRMRHSPKHHQGPCSISHPNPIAALVSILLSSSPGSFFSALITIMGLLWICMNVLSYQNLTSTTVDQNSPITIGGVGTNPWIDPLEMFSPSMGAVESFHLSRDLSRKGCSMYTLENPPPHYPYHILHVVTSRFMVGQPNQPILARARYKLFETFCWPTVRHQTRHNFFWVVLVDPGLEPSVIDDMKALLDDLPSQNAFMVLTNNTEWAADGVGVPGVSSYGAGLQEIAQAFRDGEVQVVTGRTSYLLDCLNLYEAPQHGSDDDTKPLLIIETLLDADDGLNNRGIQWIQDVAVEQTTRQQNIISRSLSSPRHTVSLNSTWWVMCGTDHIEWHNRDIFKLTKQQFEEYGLTSGLTGVRHAPTYCASAGYTRVGLTVPGYNKEDYYNSNRTSIMFPLEAYSNHALSTGFPPCDDGSTKDSNRAVTHCFRRVFPNLLYILKSRSITSDSMDHMNPKRSDYRDLSWENKTEHPLLVNETERTWKVLEDEFSIDRLQAWNTSMYLRENAEIIVQQNRESRCAPGFPCRLAAEKTFQKMDSHFKMLAGRNAREAEKKQKLLKEKVRIEAKKW